MADASDLPKDPHQEALADNLRGVHESAGVPVPDSVALRVPRISLKLEIDDLTDAVTDHLKAADGSRGLFRWHEEAVTVDGRTGKFKPMTPLSFRTWLPKTNVLLTDGQIITHNEATGEKTVKPKKGSMTIDQAKTILVSETLLAKLPEIKGVNPVKMPVFSDERDERGLRKLRLLQPGFDPPTGIFTMQAGLDFPEDVPLFDAVDGLRETFRHFGWRNEQRDLAIYIAAALTLFGRGIYLGKAPCFVLNANIQESGKSALVTWLTMMIYGSRGSRPLLEDEDEKLMTFFNSQAMGDVPYTVFDNVDWGSHVIKSAILDEWLTQGERSFNPKHSNVNISAEVRGVTLMTGNKLRVTPDLARRMMIADLWNLLPGNERVLPKDVVPLDDDAYLKSADRRKDALSWLWALVRDWDTAGRPLNPESRRIGSFGGWSDVFPHIVWHAAKTVGESIKRPDFVWNCMLPSANEDIGDTDGIEYRKLAQIALLEFGKEEETGEMRETFEITVAQLAGVMRRNALAPAYHPLYPEMDVESVMQTEGAKSGWSYDRPKDAPQSEILAAAAGFDEAADRRRSAAEWLNPKTRSSFGNAVKSKLNERAFTGPDGIYYEFKQRKGVTPARYMVARVK